MTPDPLVRPASAVDLGCAKPGCRHCGGRGIVAYRTIKEERVPVICRCVGRRGGLGPNPVDALLGPIAAALRDGTYGQKLAADVRRLPLDEQPAARAKIAAHAATPALPDPLRRALAEALAALEEPHVTA
jgi:hypothetical protein